MSTERLRYLPVSVGLGLFVGDLVFLSAAGGLSLRRMAASAAIALVAYYAAAWWVGRRLDRDG
ncbi:hypothetical protein [Euzebya tangerina]|uniref:hypothetical protein n=1 Tax=Euzebya tangerina TaxID=591198 RepID=UPI000E30EFE8|nr:hypothetical protein [Euzebya tangerina]